METMIVRAMSSGDMAHKINKHYDDKEIRVVSVSVYPAPEHELDRGALAAIIVYEKR